MRGAEPQRPARHRASSHLSEHAALLHGQHALLGQEAVPAAAVIITLLRLGCYLLLDYRMSTLRPKRSLSYNDLKRRRLERGSHSKNKLQPPPTPSLPQTEKKAPDP